MWYVFQERIRKMWHLDSLLHILWCHFTRAYWATQQLALQGDGWGWDRFVYKSWKVCNLLCIQGTLNKLQIRIHLMAYYYQEMCYNHYNWSFTSMSSDLSNMCCDLVKMFWYARLCSNILISLIVYMSELTKLGVSS